MRVAVVSGMTRPVGALVHAANLAAALGAADLEVSRAAVTDAVDARVDSDPAAVRISAADSEGRGNARALAGAIDDHIGDPIDVGHAEDPIAAQALFALRDAGRVRAVVVAVHHLEATTVVEIEQRVQASFEGADAVICASRWWADRVQREFGITPRVVPHGVDVARFAGVPEDRGAAGMRFGWGDRPVILAMGGVQPRKGSRVLLEAFARARARLGANALLVIAGVGDRPEFHRVWEEDAERLGVRIATTIADAAGADVLEFGVVDNHDMPMLYRASDVLVTPSTREGFGLVALEAAASGIPNVLSDLPVFAEHFSDGESCFSVAAGDSGSLAIGIVRAVRETAARERIVAGARRIVDGLTWDVCAQRHIAVYRDVMAALPA
jgi:glycosyltransferase involved in cell wall biosynthesis